MNYTFFKEQLINKHGTPNDETALTEYINFVLNYKKTDDGYYESHHILTRSQFPEFIKEEWNFVKLLYNDHIYAHELLFRSFNLRTYQRPLNYMNSHSWVLKNKTMVSNASKAGWKNLKNNKEKYNGWIEKRRNIMKSLSYEEQSRRAHKMWDAYTEEEYHNRCTIAAAQWTPELREKRGQLTRQYLSDKPEEMSRRMHKRWNNITKESYDDFKEKMTNVNKDIEKRNKASNAIKKKWQDDSFVEKMKNRISRCGGYICISPVGDIYEFQKFMEILLFKKFNPNLIRKFLNTNKAVEQPQKQANKEDNINTVNWIFYTKNYYLKWQKQLK